MTESHHDAFPAGTAHDPALGDLPHELLLALEGLYLAAGVQVSGTPRREPESGEYGACRLGLDGCAAAFRVAKTTPTKVGQFVTLWKRPKPGADIAPLDSTDGVDLVIVAVADATRRGQFVFDRQALIAHGVMSRSGVGGKRAIRVYPPWTNPVAKDAIRTQRWQSDYFVGLAPPEDGAAARLRRLLAAGSGA